MPAAACIFDAYGTLFDVTATARRAAEEPGAQALATRWRELADIWRAKQLQYTWLRAITGAHTDFWRVTEDSLDWAMEATGLSDAGLRARLLRLYRKLDAYPETAETLAALKSAGHPTAILSNGSADMLADAVQSAGLEGCFDAVLSVDAVGVFKPARVVYDMVGARFGCAPAEALFVSSNGWDAGAATGYGFTTVWVNRADDPVDRLPWTPHHMVDDLRAIPDLARTL